MTTQTDRTEAVWVAINRDASEMGETEAPLLAHARDLALRLDAVMELADAFMSDGMRDEFRKITSGDYTAKTDNNNKDNGNGLH